MSLFCPAAQFKKQAKYIGTSTFLSATPTIPAGAEVGDLCVIHFGSGPVASWHSLAGWNNVYPLGKFWHTAYSYRGTVFWKVLTAGDIASPGTIAYGTNYPIGHASCQHRCKFPPFTGVKVHRFDVAEGCP